MRLLANKKVRAAFTLIELIVVLTIILVLAALGVGAAAKGLGWVKQRNTEATMTKVLDRIVKRRIEGIYNEARIWTTPTVLLDQAAGDAKRAEVLKVLYLYKWSFPQTYSEAFFNFQESLALFDNVNGYPAARALYQKLFSRAPTGITQLQFIATPSAAEMAKVIPVQASACLLAAFQQFGSKDELTPSELSAPSASQYDIPGGLVSTNDLLVDAWGTPFFFMRHGNYWDNLGTRAAINRAPFWMGLLNPPIPPAVAVLEPINGQHYYDILVNTRAFAAYKSRWNTDPLDPNGLLRNSEAWRTLFPSSPSSWLAPPPVGVATWLCPPSPNAPNTWQHQDYFRSNFGYRPEPSNFDPNLVTSWPQEYAPFVIISAGGDKLFTTWDDNLDSYRLQVNLSGTQ